MARKRKLPPQVQDWLQPKPSWAVQSFEYYAAHYLVGSGLIGGDIEGNVRSLAYSMRKQYDIGVEHGSRVSEDRVPV